MMMNLSKILDARGLVDNSVNYPTNNNKSTINAAYNKSLSWQVFNILREAILTRDILSITC